MARKLVFMNRKGGVGKSTICGNIGAALGFDKITRVLFVDLDDQGSLSAVLGVDAADDMARVMCGDMPVEDALYRVRKDSSMYIIRANTGSKRAYRAAEENPNIVEERLSPIESRFDFMVFDAAPGDNALTKSALRYADGIAIPVNLELLAIKGLADVLDILKSAGALDRLLGVIPNKYDIRKKSLLPLLDLLKQQMRDKISPPIREFVVLPQATAAGQTLWEYDPGSPCAGDFGEVLAWIAERLAELEPKKRRVS